MKTINQNQNIINRKKVLYEQRYSMNRLAKEIGVTAQALALSIYGETKSYTMHKRIADKLGVKIWMFWPELYDQEPIVNQDVDHSVARS